MTKKNVKSIIEKVIMHMDRPFNQMDLYKKLYDDYRIKDRVLITDMLDDFAIAGRLDYIQISPNCWGFAVKRCG